MYEIWYGDLFICRTDDKAVAYLYGEQGFSVYDYSD